MATREADVAALNQHRQELEELLTRKTLVEEQIAHIEQQIHGFEESYLEETSNTGNVIKGFENYLGLRPLPPEKRKQKIKDTDRLFSRTSATYEKSLGIQHSADFQEDFDPGLTNDFVDDEDDDPTFKKKKKIKKTRDSEDYLDVS